MSRIEWDKAGERFFETGVDRTVLYPRLGPGVPWNGVTSIAESIDGGELEPLYFDGSKYLDAVASEDFGATIEAYSSPREFAACDGTKQISPGLFATQQPRERFGLSYRTLIGNDLVGEDFGYKIHIVYNCTAAPSNRTSDSMTGTPNPSKRQWNISTVPPPATTFKPTAHIVLDSTVTDPYLLAQFESLLYGRDGSDAYLPSVADLVAVFDTRITAFITATI